jgi:pimeloyl-ACP methyl ester carboxylesterase
MRAIMQNTIILPAVIWNLVLPCAVVLVCLAICFAGVRRWRVLGDARFAKWRRVSERVGLALVILLAVGLGATSAFNAAASYYFFWRHPAPGKIYNVGGYGMHLYCSGAGSPTVVLDAGLSNDSTIWAGVQPELSKITQVCSYDRAGFGWSEARPETRDARRLSDELHALLAAGGVNGPIILMGHSISGLYIRDYATRYPQNLVGLVFVDGSTPLQDARFPAELQEAEKKEFTLLREGEALSVLGVTRAMGQCAPEPGLGKDAGKMVAEDECRTSTLASSAQELAAVPESGEETIHTGPFGDLPILIFSQDPEHSATIPGFSAEVAKELNTTWYGMQEDLKKLSTRSRRIVAKDSSHYVQIDRMGLLKGEVIAFIKQIRGEAPEPVADYGTTTVK